MKKKIILSVVVFMAFFLLAGVAKTKAAYISGWLWGGSEETSDGTINGNESGVGWISLSSLNCDPDHDGTTEGTTAGGVIENPDYPNCPSGVPSVNYSFMIPPGNGEVEGYAWSSNLGYIDFQPQRHCTTGAIDSDHPYRALSCNDPEGGTGGVTRSANDLVGWARVVDIARASADGNSGGWEGWIKMSGSNYGVTIDTINNKLNGFAWSGEKAGTPKEGLGYISFANAKYPPEPQVRLWVTKPATVDPGLNEHILDMGDLAGRSLPSALGDVTLNWEIKNGKGGHCYMDASESHAWVGNFSVSSDDEFGSDSGVEAVSSEGPIVTNNPYVEFKLDCEFDTGEAVPFKAQGKAKVYVGCKENKCDSMEKCSGILTPVDSSNSGICVAQSTCSSDTQCESKSTGDWKEIDPGENF
jgi:hypothetical protein